MNSNVVSKIKFSPVNIESRRGLNFSSGDTVKVWSKIVDEKGKSRLQAFEGVVLARKHGAEPGATFTVRKTASGVGVERIFPLFSPVIDKIEVTKKSRARRSKLYYIRDKAMKKIRKKLRISALTGQEENLSTEDYEDEVVAKSNEAGSPDQPEADSREEKAVEKIKEPETLAKEAKPEEKKAE